MRFHVVTLFFSKVPFELQVTTRVYHGNSDNKLLGNTTVYDHNCITGGFTNVNALENPASGRSIYISLISLALLRALFRRDTILLGKRKHVFKSKITFCPLRAGRPSHYQLFSLLLLSLLLL